jgi:nucleoside-diphosphate-sugar epimerase
VPAPNAAGDKSGTLSDYAGQSQRAAVASMEKLCSSQAYKARRQPCSSFWWKRILQQRRRSERPVRSMPKRETIAIRSLFLHTRSRHPCWRRRISSTCSSTRHYTPAEMKAAAERDRKVRVEGNINLLAALRDSGVRRYLLQSSGFWYAPGAGLAHESVPFISSASPAVQTSARTYLELETRASATPGIEVVALRYGFFYGPGTWYTREGDIGDQVRQQQVPIIGEGQGVCSFVHIDDAAGATAAALDCPPGAYNIVDGNPSPQHLWLTAFARAAGAPAPPRVSEEEALRASGPDAVYYATRLRGASNEKARRELDFHPRPLEWILDQRSD